MSSRPDSLSNPLEQSRPRPFRAAIIVVAALACTFWSVARHDFVVWDDDQTIYTNRQLVNADWSTLARSWMPQRDELVYQPATSMFMIPAAIVARLKAPDPAVSALGSLLNPHPFHLLSLSLHVVNCLLVYAFLAMLLKCKPSHAAVGALIFGLHPLQVESVAWASSVDRTVNGLFSLTALMLYTLSARESGRARQAALFLATIVLGVLAYLAKPVAITLPIAALAIDRFIIGRKWKPVLINYAIWQIVYAPLYLLTRSLTPGQSVQATPLWTRLFIAGDALAWHLYKVLLPFNLGIDYGLTPRYILHHWWAYVLWLVPAALLFALARLKHADSAICAALLWLAALIPDIGLVPFPFEQYSVVADRYDYLALLGPAMGVAAILSQTRWKYALPVASVVLILYAGLAAAQCLVWTDTPALMSQALAVNRRSALACLNMGVYYCTVNKLDVAMSYYETALSINPSYDKAHGNLGGILDVVGDYAQAEAQLRQAIQENPDNGTAHLNLAIALQNEHRYVDAENEYRTAIEQEPDNLDCACGLADCLAQAGDLAAARTELASVLSVAPNYKQALVLQKSLDTGTYR